MVGSFVIGGFGSKLVMTGGLGVSSPQILLFSAALEVYLQTNLEVEVYPVNLPQWTEAYPLLTYKRRDRGSYYTMSAATKLVHVVYEINAIGNDKLAVDTLGEQLRGVLEGFKGNLGGLTVTGCREMTQSYKYTAPVWNADLGTHTRTTVFAFDYLRN